MRSRRRSSGASGEGLRLLLLFAPDLSPADKQPTQHRSGKDR